MRGQRHEKVILQASITEYLDPERWYAKDSPERIAADSLACIAEGAAIVHNHIDRTRCSGAEAAERYLQGWRPVLAQHPDMIFFPTGHYGADGTHDFSHVEALAQSGVLRMSFIDFGISALIEGMDADGLPRGTRLYANDFDRTAGRVEAHRRLGLASMLNIFDLAGLRTAMLWHRAGKLPPGCWLNLYFTDGPTANGSPGFLSLPPILPALDTCLALMDGCGLPWGVSLFGGDLVEGGFGRQVLAAGGHLTVGRENYAGPRQPTNAQLVREAATLCGEMGLEIATPAQAAALLGLSEANGAAGED